MSKGIFITGTDTDVGKTVVSALIARAFISRGIKVGVMKPVETGCINDKGILIPPDGVFLKKMAQVDDSIDLIVPVRFEHPLAPMVASQLGGTSVEVDRLINAYKNLSNKYDFVVVEGIGGLLVPLTRIGYRGGGSCYFVSDLVKELKLPLIIVTRPTLGTINHTLLTVNHALKENIKVPGIIINCNEPSKDGIAEKTNPGVLKELSPVPVLGIVPYIENITADTLDEIALKVIDIDVLQLY
ncbi:MAG: dethiobiotin synthase [Thermodesulfovibrio sp.]|nr:dethiobiotin synthase [Thermodesulfovibrio sp.]